MCGVLLAKDAEVYGLREAISWALMMGFSSVTFELDTKIIVDAFYSTKLMIRSLVSLFKIAIFSANKGYNTLFALPGDKLIRLLMLWLDSLYLLLVLFILFQLLVLRESWFQIYLNGNSFC